MSALISIASREVIKEAPRNPVADLIESLKDAPQLEAPVQHLFSDGIYMREIRMPADSIVIGHPHKTRHWNIILSGRAIVSIDGVSQEIVGPCRFESHEGAQKCLHVLEEMVWITVHPNPSNSQDLARIEESMVILDQDTLAEKGDRLLDEHRMTKNADRIT